MQEYLLQPKVLFEIHIGFTSKYMESFAFHKIYLNMTYVFLIGKFFIKNGDRGIQPIVGQYTTWAETQSPEV